MGVAAIHSFPDKTWYQEFNSIDPEIAPVHSLASVYNLVLHQVVQTITLPQTSRLRYQI